MNNVAGTYIEISNFDSVVQAETWRKTTGVSCAAAQIDLWQTQEQSQKLLRDNPCLVHDFASLLRITLISCETLVVTDAELLDGVFFQALGPSGVKGMLGLEHYEKLNIKVLGRCDGSLVECLREIVSEDGFNTSLLNAAGLDLKDCEIKYEEAVATAAQSALNNADAKDVPRLAARAMEASLGLASGSLDFLASQWSSWCNAQEQGIIEYSKFPERDFEQGFKTTTKEFEAPGKSFLRARIDDAQSLAEALSVLDEVANEQVRSKAAGVMTRKISDETAVVFVRDWYRFCYLKALAKQHGAELLNISGTDNTFVSWMSESDFKEMNVKRLSWTIMSQVGNMHGIDYRTTFDHSKEFVRKWRKSPCRKCAESWWASFNLARAFQHDYGIEPLREIAAKLVVCAAAVVASLVGFVQSMLNIDFLISLLVLAILPELPTVLDIINLVVKMLKSKSDVAVWE